MADIIITEKNIEQFKDSLGSIDAIDQIKTIVDDFVQSGSIGDAYNFLRKLQIVIKDLNLVPNIKGKYSEFILYLEYTALPLLDDNEQQELLSNHLLFALKNEIDLKDRIHLIFFPYFTSEDGKKISLLLRSLETNYEPLAGKTIGAWIRDYNQTKKFDSGGSVFVVKYLTQNSATRLLDTKSSELLKNILLLFDWIRYQAVPEEFRRGGTTTSSVPPKLTPKQALPISRPIISKPQQVAVPIMHGAPLEVLKAKMEARTVVKFTPPKLPSPPSSVLRTSSPVKGEDKIESVRMTPQEIKREVATKELPVYKENLISPLRRDVAVGDREVTTPPGPSGHPPLKGEGNKVAPVMSNIQTIDDLKKLGLSYLRTGQIQTQTSNLKSIIINLAQANHVLPYFVVSSFEQSPLFKSYMAHGNSKVIGSGPAGEMTQAEFEAMADLRKEIERL